MLLLFIIIMQMLSQLGSEGSTSTHDRNAKTSPAHTHTCNQRQTLRNNTTIHKTATKTEVELFYMLQRSRGHKEHLKQN